MARINFNNISIKNKLVVIQLFTVFIVLLIYSVFNFFSDMNLYRDSVARELTIMARVIGFNCKSTLNFLDSKAAEEILASLEAEENIVNAWIHDTEGKLFGKYSKSSGTGFVFPKSEDEHLEYKDGYFYISQKIIQDNKTIGMISMRYDMSRYRRVLIKNLVIALLVLTGGMAIAFLLSVFTRKTISKPISQLAGTLTLVGETGDYTIRSETSRGDEIGRLYHGFNDMLQRIHTRGIERDRADRELRQKVQEITAMNTLARKVSASLSVGQVVQSAIEGICEPIQPDIALFFLRDGDRLLLQGTGPKNSPYRHENGKTPIHHVGECLCGLAAADRKAAYSIDIFNDKRCTRDECKKGGFQSFAALPLRRGEEIIGVLGLGSRTQRDFEKQKTFLDTLSNEIAIGLQNAILYEKISRYSIELEERVRERTKELQQANTKLKELDRLKSMFLASMSHELRTPLNSIIGFTGLLLMGLSGELNPEQQKQLNMVKGSANHLLSLINDILDISRIESGKVNLDIGPFEIADVVTDVVETVAPSAEEKGLALLTDIQEDIAITSDRRRVKQVLMNLVANAVKFTENGTVKISVTRLPRNQTAITVSDTGPGIREEDMENLFKPFQQIDMSSTKKHEGTGLGLYLCKKLTDLLNGDISVKSRYGKGSDFTFHLPLDSEGRGKREERGENEESTGHRRQ